MIYILVDIQFKDLKFDTHMQDIFVLVVKRFEVVCTSNLETAHNLMSLGWVCVIGLWSQRVILMS